MLWICKRSIGWPARGTKGDANLSLDLDQPTLPFGLEIGKIVKYAGLNSDQLDLILGKNLARLLRIEPKPSAPTLLDRSLNLPPALRSGRGLKPGMIVATARYERVVRGHGGSLRSAVLLQTEDLPELANVAFRMFGQLRRSAEKFQLFGIEFGR